ncbi:hypothetical protein DFQ27_003931, partial [Actinomortierella ambigua]
MNATESSRNIPSMLRSPPPSGEQSDVSHTAVGFLARQAAYDQSANTAGQSQWQLLEEEGGDKDDGEGRKDEEEEKEDDDDEEEEEDEDDDGWDDGDDEEDERDQVDANDPSQTPGGRDNDVLGDTGGIVDNTDELFNTIDDDLDTAAWPTTPGRQLETDDEVVGDEKSEPPISPRVSNQQRQKRPLAYVAQRANKRSRYPGSRQEPTSLRSSSPEVYWRSALSSYEQAAIKKTPALLQIEKRKLEQSERRFEYEQARDAERLKFEWRKLEFEKAKDARKATTEAKKLGLERRKLEHEKAKEAREATTEAKKLELGHRRLDLEERRQNAILTQ